MINNEKSIYLQETEVRPNHYAMIVLLLTIGGLVFCWALTEIGIFRVGKWEMRLGAGIPIVLSSVLLLAIKIKPELSQNPKTKYYIVSFGIIVSLSVNILLNFHTTMMLLFPIFFAMLYRSRKLGIIACIGSIVSTIVSPILGYVLGTWDIPLLQELILIGTGQEVVIDPVYAPVSLIPIIKIILYLVIPRLVLVASCSALLFYVIRIGVDHVNNMLILNQVSHRDNLTGLYNRNYLNELLASPDINDEIGVIYFDVNGLKAANDSRGHEYGDLLLKRCAQSLLDVCEEDRVHAFRAGGDEFLLLLEKADEDFVIRKLKQWEEALKKINQENKDNLEEYEGIICSMAAGYKIGNFRDFDELIHQADKEMYNNKTLMKAAMSK